MHHSNHNPKCSTCGGSTHASAITYEQTIGNEHVLVTGVPAHVCDQCGSRQFDFNVAAKLERLVESGTPVRTVETPVYEFSSEAVIT